jgi:hypothetical protein
MRSHRIFRQGPKVDLNVKRLSKENYNQAQIKNKLKEKNVDDSITTECCVLKNVGIRQQALSGNKPHAKFQRQPFMRILHTMKKVETMVTKENDTSYKTKKNKLRLSLLTIHKVIHQDLKLDI